MTEPEKLPTAQGAVGPRRLQRAAPWLAIPVIVAATIVQLRIQGRLWWCACGQPFLWSGNIWSQHNSQHLADPYSFTHVLHGMLFYGLLAWACPRWRLAWRFVLAFSVEALW